MSIYKICNILSQYAAGPVPPPPSIDNSKQPAPIKYASCSLNSKVSAPELSASGTSFVKYQQSAAPPAPAPPPPPPQSPNAQLYQKLLKLISSSSSYSEQINSQMNTLLANPNIKAQLKQLHTQLLKNPNQYLPQLENILLDSSPTLSLNSTSTSNNNNYINNNNNNDYKENYNSKDNLLITENDESPQDLLDLRQYYARDDETKRFNNNKNILINQRINKEYKY